MIKSYSLKYPGINLHSIGPYIGKMRPSLARLLIEKYSKQNDIIWDPFCGSGTIPLEAYLLNRNVIAGDINPYALLLTKAKLFLPKSYDEITTTLIETKLELKEKTLISETEIPEWVKKFFHPKTLSETLFLTKKLLNNNNYFLLGCLIGILHHQRPGFLSFPSSHLVPYLRDGKYPISKYPEAYCYRDPLIRLDKKAKRTLLNPPLHCCTKCKVINYSAEKEYNMEESIDMVITSPPYMHALDYSRDNRLRLWFLGIDDYSIIKKKEICNVKNYYNLMPIVITNIAKALKPNGKCIFIIGDVQKSNSSYYNIPEFIRSIICDQIKNLKLEESWIDELPNIKRSRKEGFATKKEVVFVFKKS